jgi:hypothetical protein
MKVLIQNPLTLSYFAGERKWTARSDEAIDFSESRKAASFCLEHHLLEMQIVLKFHDDRYDVHMPAWTAIPRQMPPPRAAQVGSPLGARG